MDGDNTCNFLKHSSNPKPVICSYFCKTCALRICSDCISIHNSNPNNFSHEIEQIGKNITKWKLKFAEIEGDKIIMKINDKIRNDIENMEAKFGMNLNQLNNKYRYLMNDYISQYTIIEDIDENIENKNKNKEKIDYQNLKKNLYKSSDELENGKRNIDYLINSVKNLLNRKYINLSIHSNINNFSILGKLHSHQNKNYINKSKENENIRKNEINTSHTDNSSKEKQNQFQKNNSIGVKLISKSNERKLNIHKNPGEESISSNISIDEKKEEKIGLNNTLKEDKKQDKNNINPKKIELIPPQLCNYNKENNLLNKKQKRERKRKECCNFCEDCQHSSNNSSKKNKKRKFLSQNNPLSESKLPKINNEVSHFTINNKKNENNDNKIELQNINERIINSSNNNNNGFNFFNLRDDGNELCLILSKINQNIVNLTCFKSNDIRHQIPFLHCEKFPFLYSKIININNKAFIIGGKSHWNTSEKGNNFAFRLNYINNDSKKISNELQGDIICTPLNDTRLKHLNHHLIYSEKYNAIFVLSGRAQRGCEYAILDKNKNFVSEWKEFPFINLPRENAIGLLFNEKYIFLIGGQGQNSNNYDVFDISSIFESNKPQIWKTYNYITNQYNKYIFSLQNAGIIMDNNKLYLLGGYKNDMGKCLSWKIDFTSDADDQINDNYKRIEKISVLRNKIIEECEGLMYFYGQQKFDKYNDCFININIQGKIINFPKNILEK